MRGLLTLSDDVYALTAVVAVDGYVTATYADHGADC